MRKSGGEEGQKDRKDLVGERLGVIMEREVYGWEYFL